MEMAAALDFDELLYLNQGHETTGGKKKKEKSVYFQNTKCQRKKKRVDMNQVKVPNRVQSVFLYTISGVKKNSVGAEAWQWRGGTSGSIADCL